MTALMFVVKKGVPYTNGYAFLIGLIIDDIYLAISTTRVSRMTCTLI
jgi:cell shape-determining protein MreD